MFARRRLAPIVFLALVAAIYATVRARRDLVDFDVYRTAGLRAAAAAPLYRPEDGHYQFKYLPAFAVAMIPLGWIGAEPAKAIWFVLSAALLVQFFRASVDHLPDRRRTMSFLLWWTVLLTGKLWVKELSFGQTNVWISLLALAAMGAVHERRPVVAGLFVGAAVFVKPYAAILLPWLVVSAGTDALVAFSAVVALGLWLPAVRYGWSGNLQLLTDWFRTVTSTTAPNLLLPENVSIATMWAKWIGEGTTASVLAGLTSVATVGAACSALALRRRVTRPDYLEIAALLLVIPLVSPQGWDYVLLLGVPAIVCILDRWSSESRRWRLMVTLSIGTIACTIFDLIGRVAYTHLMMWSVESVAALGILAAVCHLRARALA